MKVIQSNENGTQEEYEGRATSAGAADAGHFPVLNPAGKIDQTMMPDGVGQDIVQLTSAEALSEGDYIYINSAGAAARADATSIAKKAIGFATESVVSGAPVKVQFDDSNTALSGLTPGATYYLSASTPGGVTTTAPTAAGQIVQSVGVALNATTIHSDIQSQPVIRA